MSGTSGWTTSPWCWAVEEPYSWALADPPPSSPLLTIPTCIHTISTVRGPSLLRRTVKYSYSSLVTSSALSRIPGLYCKQASRQPQFFGGREQGILEKTTNVGDAAYMLSYHIISYHIVSYHIVDLKWQNCLKVGTDKSKLRVQMPISRGGVWLLEWGIQKLNSRSKGQQWKIALKFDRI